MRVSLIVPVISMCWSIPLRAEPRVETVPGEILVGWRAPLPGTIDRPLRLLRAEQIATGSVAGHAVLSGRLLDRRTELLRVDPGVTTEAIAALAARPDVAFVEPNHVRRICAVQPDDEHYPIQWYLGSARIEEAWELTTGDEHTVVAVIDTGIRRGHPDLAGRLLQGYDFISSPEKAGDGDGRDGDPNDEGTGDPTSSGLHGTHVAGIIAALANNGEGIAGIDWKAKLLPVRALGVEGKGDDADISDAIRWAAGLEVPGAPLNTTPARVINLSFGSRGHSLGYVLTNAIAAAIKAGAIVVAAAGNDGVDARDIYPAAIPGVITVGATDYDGALAPYSNFGNVVDLVAPGGNLGERLPFSHQDQQWAAGIISTMYDVEQAAYNYSLNEGTSQAAPIVSGVISLMLALDPTLTQHTVAEALLDSADERARCEQGCGRGALDARAALAKLSGAPGPGDDVQPDVYAVACTVGRHPAGPPAPVTLGALLLLALLGRRRPRRP